MSEELKFEPTAESLLAILERLRAPGGCPWDREQTRLSLSRSLAEECAELLDAIDRDDPAFRIFSSEPGTYQAGVNLK